MMPKVDSYKGQLLVVALSASIALSSVAGCAAIFPRYSTAERDIPAAMMGAGGLTPPPPDLFRLGVVSADVARTTRDGRPWDNDAGPDLFVVIQRNGDEIFRSRVIDNHLVAEWNSETDAVDLFVRESDVLHFELRDDDGTFGGSELVGAVDIRGGIPTDARGGANWTVRLEGGAQVVLATHNPRPHLGMGVVYEYRHESLVMVEVREAGPGHNAGLRVGDRVLRINGRAVGQMAEMEVRQAMDRSAMTEVALAVEHPGRPVEELTIRADALYNGR